MEWNDEKSSKLKIEKMRESEPCAVLCYATVSQYSTEYTKLHSRLLNKMTLWNKGRKRIISIISSEKATQRATNAKRVLKVCQTMIIMALLWCDDEVQK